ncbi:MAG: CopG family transcriptional regulator [Micromonosporaceae bacterium]
MTTNEDLHTTEELRALAEAAGVAEALARGEQLQFQPADAAAEAELLAQLPPSNAPVTVVRPVRLPYETDALVKALAEARGVSMSDLIRDWIAIGLAAAGQTRDPVIELRHSLDTAQRALDSLTGRAPGGGRRDVA